MLGTWLSILVAFAGPAAAAQPFVSFGGGLGGMLPASFPNQTIDGEDRQWSYDQLDTWTGPEVLFLNPTGALSPSWVSLAVGRVAQRGFRSVGLALGNQLPGVWGVARDPQVNDSDPYVYRLDHFDLSDPRHFGTLGVEFVAGPRIGSGAVALEPLASAAVYLDANNLLLLRTVSRLDSNGEQDYFSDSRFQLTNDVEEVFLLSTVGGGAQFVVGGRRSQWVLGGSVFWYLSGTVPFYFNASLDLAGRAGFKGWLNLRLIR